MAGIVYNRNDTKCALCRMNDANEVGSHMAPNFIIHLAFSFDGNGPRDREIVAREHINDEWRPVYYGRSVNPDAINADRGRDLTPEEIDDNLNILVYDHIFCKDCEKRFSVLEQEYRQFYANPNKKISARIAYLFWLSVFWRMSIGYMAILMGIEDELKIRTILDNNLKSKSEMENSIDNLGDFGYVIWRTNGIKKGYSGIFGTRSLNSPYMVILNDLVVILMSDVSKISFPFEYADIHITKEMVNTPDSKISVQTISLEEFAKFKRFILDQPIIEGWGPLYEKALRRFREEDRTSGIPHSNKMEKEILSILEELEKSYCEKPLFYRYHEIMTFAELKIHAAKRLGVEYDLLTDETMFLFPFDIDNYKKDCKELVKLGYDIYSLPLAESILLSNEQKNNTEKMERMNHMWEHKLDSLLSISNYSLRDLLYDNLRSKEI